ncbi:hypothetical protein AWC19_25625 [Mycobacterium palustre]|uniref:Uncharacterized protein n=1 Tax=Mycobacterium palustre TaxID=153971 RepID=A0A1X1ZYB8_9MYCO|nr:hypothetical protein AWC19_25625 [Mycobacterium palustre]
MGSVNADVVALEARRAAEQRAGLGSPPGGGEGAQVLRLAEHRLIADERPLPSVAPYDTLLGQQSS